MRSMLAAVQTASRATVVRPIVAVELDFQSGFVRLADTPFNVTDASGNVFNGVGALGSISSIDEGLDKQARGISLKITGIDPAFISTALGEQYQGRSCKVFVALMDDNHQIIPNMVQLGEWLMDTMNVTIGATAAISVKAESVLIAWDTPNLMRWTDSEQRLLHPADRGLEHVNASSEAPFQWGTV